MKKQAYLVLADGSFYEGLSFGGDADTFGEIVFNTSMIGYQEMLTDPSYAGQILMPTYPLIGNYGINEQDDETSRIQVRGFVVREECLEPSHYLSKKTLHRYLLDGGISGICGLDTRSITRKLRSVGVMMGMITSRMTPEQAFAELNEKPDYGATDYVREVSTKESFVWEKEKPIEYRYNVVAYDCGLKYNILRLLKARGCKVTVMPCTSTAEEILKLNPDGILLSPGPGDPEILDYAVKTVRGTGGEKTDYGHLSG